MPFIRWTRVRRKEEDKQLQMWKEVRFVDTLHYATIDAEIFVTRAWRMSPFFYG